MTGFVCTMRPSAVATHWIVTCSCGFYVELGTEEAANDTVRWHSGLPSSLGDETGVPGDHFDGSLSTIESNDE